jgi:hypothetical protein
MFVLMMEVFIRYTVQMASEGIIYVQSFMKIGSGIQVMLKLLPRQFERW